MSEPIAESIPTSADPRSHRPLKRARGPGSNNPNLKASSAQANEIQTLFLDPTREVKIPPTSAESKKSLPAPPEIVANVQGSSAGAGSGEFHVYKASRRREFERLRLMDEEIAKQKNDAEWEGKLEELRKRDEAKTNKNKAKREKAKARKGKSKAGDAAANGTTDVEKVVRPVKPTVGAASSDVKANMDAAVVGTVEEVGLIIHDED